MSVQMKELIINQNKPIRETLTVVKSQTGYIQE